MARTVWAREVKLKFRAVVTAAVEMGAEAGLSAARPREARDPVRTGAQVLVCPDVGCGVFGNEPKAGKRWTAKHASGSSEIARVLSNSLSRTSRIRQVLGTLLGEVLREPQAQNLNEALQGDLAPTERGGPLFGPVSFRRQHLDAENPWPFHSRIVLG